MDKVMHAWLGSADDILRRAPWVTDQFGSRRALARMVACLVLFGLLYGVVMGSFRALASQPQWLTQIVYSGIKVPLLLTVTFAISLPSFYVVNALLGLRRDFIQAIRALVAAQAGLAIVLASLAPLTLLWYASSGVHRHALLFNGLMFAVASFTAQWLVRGYYRPLIMRNSRHRWLLWCWLLVYTVVAIQMAWLLRPFLGVPGEVVEFTRPEAWDNAYVIVLRMIWKTLFG
jgi:hypothetical protein